MPSLPAPTTSTTAAPSTDVASTTDVPLIKKKMSVSKRRRARYNARNEEYNQNCRNLLEHYEYENTLEFNLDRRDVTKTDKDHTVLGVSK
jgi:hypothetical protein